MLCSIPKNIFIIKIFDIVFKKNYNLSFYDQLEKCFIENSKIKLLKYI
jgi:hypothetical protein